MRVGLVATLREPLEKLIHFVNYHLNVGIDHLYLFFDDPDDPAANKMTDPRVTSTRCSSGYWKEQLQRLSHGDLQSIRERCPELYKHFMIDLVQPRVTIETRQQINVAVALRYAKRHDLDWIFHVDGDELVYVPERSLKQELAKVPPSTDFLVFGTLEAVPEREVYRNEFLEATLFRDVVRLQLPLPMSMHTRCANSLAKVHAFVGKLAGCRNAFFNGEYFRGHIIGKSIVRTSSDSLELGMHLPYSNKPLTLRISNTGRILHYDCVTFEAWLEKWKRRFDGTAKASVMRKNRIQQGNDFLKLHRAGNVEELKKLYRELYFVPAREQWRLFSLGLLRRIQLPQSTFLAPPTESTAKHSDNEPSSSRRMA
jgi:Glycosyl transferase family 2